MKANHPVSMVHVSPFGVLRRRTRSRMDENIVIQIVFIELWKLHHKTLHKQILYIRRHSNILGPLEFEPIEFYWDIFYHTSSAVL